MCRAVDGAEVGLGEPRPNFVPKTQKAQIKKPPRGGIFVWAKLVAGAGFDAEAAWSSSGGIIVDNPDWFQVNTPSSNLIPLNGVYRSGLTSDCVIERLEKSIADFGQSNTPYRSVITGASQPLDLLSLVPSE